MADLNLLDTLTRKVFMPGMADGIFRSGALLAHLKANCLKTWPGGGVNTWQEDFIYDRLNGSTLSRAGGDTFNITQKQIEAGLTWDARAAQVSIAADLRRLNVELTGEGAYFDYIDTRMQAAALTMSEWLAISLYKHGQALPGARTEEINGLDEALNDGTNLGYEGSTFTTYGTATRALYNGALNSPMTLPTANVAGPITYPLMEQAYGSVTVGQQMPNLITTTQLGLSFIKMAFQSQQRYQPAEETKFGFTGVKFNGATIMADNYAPGSSTLTAAAPGALGAFNNTTGESLWFLNVSRDNMGLYLSSNDLMGFGFTGWKPAQDNLSVAGQYLFAGNFTVRQPRFSRYLFGITG